MAQKEIIFVTGNVAKLRLARKICEEFDISLIQATFDITEIQAEDGEIIARDKADKAYKQAGKPVLVNDDSWTFPGLNGFPGPYMKSMNHWLTAEDFLRLTKPLTDRRVILSQYTVYQDEREQKLFQRDIEGALLSEVRGQYDTSPNMTIISFDGGQTSGAEKLSKGQSVVAHLRTTWHDFGEWYTKERA